MNWISLIGPAVVAALISGVVSGIGILISARTARSIHTEKLAFDREQTQQRTAAEIELAERKMKADTELAERKFTFDKTLVSWRRRYDLAEQVLASAYEARDTLNWARVRVVLAGEGETRAATGPESQKLRADRNSAFVPIERLARNAKPFATLQALRDTLAAHFGPEATAPVAAIMEVHHSITNAASMLVQLAEFDDDRSARQQLLPLRMELWGERPDDKDKKVDAAIERLEALCKPILSMTGPA
jgi:hypothetical protein